MPLDRNCSAVQYVGAICGFEGLAGVLLDEYHRTALPSGHLYEFKLRITISGASPNDMSSAMRIFGLPAI